MLSWLANLARAARPKPRADRDVPEMSPEPPSPPRRLPIEADAARLVLQVGHASVVESVSLSPDGRYAVTGALDGTLRLWDVASGLQLRTLIGGDRPTAAEDRVLEGNVQGRFAPRGARVLFWDDRRFGVLDLDDPARSFQVDQPQRSNFLCFVDGGTKIFAADGWSTVDGDDNHARLALFDAGDGRRLAAYAVPLPRPWSGQASVRCQVTPDGDTALVALDRAAQDAIAFRVWDLTEDAPAGDYAGPNGLRDLDVSPSGQRFLAVGADNRAYVWDRGRLPPRLSHGAASAARPEVGDTVVIAARFLDSDDAVALLLKTIDSVTDYQHERVVSGPCALARWDLATDTVTDSAPCHDVRLGDLPVLEVAHGNLLSARDANWIDLWDLARWAPFRTLIGSSLESSARMEDISVDGAETLALLSYQDGKRLLVDLRRGKLIRTLRDDDFQHAHVSPDGNYLAIGSRIEAARTGEVKIRGDWQYAYGFHGDGDLVLVRGEGEQVVLIEAATGAVIAAMPVPPIDPDEVAHSAGEADPGEYEPVVAEEAALSPDRRFLVTAGARNRSDYVSDDVVRVWDFATGELIGKLERGPESYWVEGLAFSRNGSLLLVVSEQPQLWRTADWTRLCVLGTPWTEYYDNERNYAAATSARLVNDDSQVLTTHDNGKVRLWSAVTGEEVAAMQDRHAGRATAAVWLGARGTVLSVGFDAVVRVCRADDGARVLHYLPRGGDDWVVVDAQGRFDAAGEVGDAVVRVYRDRAYALDRLSEDFREPGLLGRHLGPEAEPLRDVSDITRLLSRLSD